MVRRATSARAFTMILSSRQLFISFPGGGEFRHLYKQKFYKLLFIWYFVFVFLSRWEGRFSGLTYGSYMIVSRKSGGKTARPAVVMRPSRRRWATRARLEADQGLLGRRGVKRPA